MSIFDDAYKLFRSWELSRKGYEKEAIDVKNVVRVQFYDDGSVGVIDFTRPQEINTAQGIPQPQDTVPPWVIEAVCMLRITEPMDLVEGVGFKLDENVYYVGIEYLSTYMENHRDSRKESKEPSSQYP